MKKARSFLFSRNIKGIRPALFASAAKEMDVSFYELLRYISRLYAGGQAQAAFLREVLLRAAGKPTGDQ